MDFSKFRQSGDLSDLTVVVGDESYRLHKFPLFARSEFFCTVARNSPDRTNRVELPDFPGGKETFEAVADFCYNIQIDVTKDNVVEMRCAAHFLQMTGEGNLSDLTEKFFHDAITSAKLTRSSEAVTELLQHSVSTGAMAERVGIVDECIDALLECWLRPTTMFISPSHSPRHPHSNSDRKSKRVATLTELPDQWFVNLLSKGKAKGVDSSHLVVAAHAYLVAAMDGNQPAPSECKASEKTDEEEAEKEDASDRHTDANDENPSPSSTESEATNKKMAKLLDMVLLELPSDVSLANHVTPDWVIRCLKIATAHNCKCTAMLIRAAGELFKTLSPDELCSMSPVVIHDIISESLSLKPDEDVYASSCALLDLYLQILTDNTQLRSDTFKLLAAAVPAEHRESDDQLYIALEFVLKSEENLSPEIRKELIETVNFRSVDDAILERALDEGVIPAEKVARVALERCQHLRAELNSTKVSEKLEETYHSDYNLRFLDNQQNITPARPSQPAAGRWSSRSSTPDERPRSLTDGLTYGHPERDLKSDLDSAPIRVKAVPPYAYRPIRDLDLSYAEEHGYRTNNSLWSSGNLRTPRTTYPSTYRHHRQYSHRI